MAKSVMATGIIFATGIMAGCGGNSAVSNTKLELLNVSLATEYLKYLYSDEGQEIAVKISVTRAIKKFWQK